MVDQIKVRSEFYILLQFANVLGFSKAQYIYSRIKLKKKKTTDIYLYSITQPGYIETIW